MKEYTIQLEDGISEIVDSYIKHVQEHYPNYNMSTLVRSLIIDICMQVKREKEKEIKNGKSKN